MLLQLAPALVPPSLGGMGTNGCAVTFSGQSISWPVQRNCVMSGATVHVSCAGENHCLCVLPGQIERLRNIGVRHHAVLSVYTLTLSCLRLYGVQSTFRKELHHLPSDSPAGDGSAPRFTSLVCPQSFRTVVVLPPLTALPETVVPQVVLPLSVHSHFTLLLFSHHRIPTPMQSRHEMWLSCTLYVANSSVNSAP